MAKEISGATSGTDVENIADENDRSEPVRDSGAQKCFEEASRLGPLLLLCLLALYVWPAFWGMGFLCPAETKNIEILRHVIEQGAWLAPAVGESAQWPGFSAFFVALRGVCEYFGQTMPLSALIVSGGALCSFLALSGIWRLSLTAGFGRQAALAAGLIPLCAPIVMLLARFVSPEILAVALTMFSLCCFCSGWQREKAGIVVPAGFLFAALGALTGGPYYLLLPLLTSLIFLCWTGRIRRAGKFDAVFGFALCLALPAVWLGCVILRGAADGGYLQSLFSVFPLPGNPPEFWRRSSLAAGIMFLPWLLLVFFVSWGRVLREATRTLRGSRAEFAGAAFAWLALVCAVLLAPVGSGLTGTGIMAGCLAAPLLGRALTRLSGFGSRLFYVFVILCLITAAAGLVALSFSFAGNWLFQTFQLNLPPGLADNPSLPGIGICCLTAAFVLARFTDLTKAVGALLACSLLTVVLAQPVMLWFAPRLGDMGMAHMTDIDALRRSDAEKYPASPERNVPAVREQPQQTAPDGEQPGRIVAPEEAPAALDAPGPDASLNELEPGSSPAHSSTASGVAPAPAQEDIREPPPASLSNGTAGGE
ncbi:MAG: hypothetical protein LBC94_05900 [Desulfovibrio sp.]|jgi:4-amino-4-deoxy-L-arabinose transferase-like glycosyltransferase|nr:hypothetical protein [Desulfovibrio sp.]